MILSKPETMSDIYNAKATEVFKFETEIWKKYSTPPETRERFQQILDAELNRLKGR